MIILILRTYILLLGPPVAIMLAAYSYYEYKKRKGKRVSMSKKLLFNIPLSLISSTWITRLIENCELFDLPLSDCERLQIIKHTIASIIEFIPPELRELVPAEIMLIIVLGIIIYLLLSPA